MQNRRRVACPGAGAGLHNAAESERAADGGQSNQNGLPQGSLAVTRTGASASISARDW